MIIHDFSIHIVPCLIRPSEQTITNIWISWVGFYRGDFGLLDGTTFDMIGLAFVLKKTWFKTGYFVWYNGSLAFIITRGGATASVVVRSLFPCLCSDIKTSILIGSTGYLKASILIGSTGYLKVSILIDSTAGFIPDKGFRAVFWRFPTGVFWARRLLAGRMGKKEINQSKGTQTSYFMSTSVISNNRE